MSKLNEPKVSRVYQNHHLDSTRWQAYSPRKNDIIITSGFKAGTTWTQDIFYHLIYGLEDQAPSQEKVQIWPDAHFWNLSKDRLARWLKAIKKRRYLKSHLPFDGLPYYREVKYIVVCRDPRDVFMSLHNHYLNYTETMFSHLNNPELLMGAPLPQCPSSPREFWHKWMTKGWFPWEKQGYPFWSNMHHNESYWQFKHLPNLFFLHYADLWEKLEASIERLCDFCEIETTFEHIQKVAELTNFANVKRRALTIKNDPMTATFRGGKAGFVHKGKNGRWKEVLTDEDLALYERVKNELHTPACAAWLEQGGSTDAL